MWGAAAFAGDAFAGDAFAGDFKESVVRLFIC
jgi:hypothetical protein